MKKHEIGKRHRREIGQFVQIPSKVRIAFTRTEKRVM